AAETIWEDPSNSESIALADFDRDGDLDLAAATVDGPVVWLPNLAPGFGPAQTLHTRASVGAVFLVAADLDDDGWSDLVAYSGDEGVHWFRNQADGSFAGAVALGDFPSPDLPAALAAADLDADGDLDLALADRNDSRLGWLENLGGDGPAFDLHLRALAEGFGLRDLAVADLDGDGDLDLAHGGRGGVEHGWWPNQGGQVRLAATDVAQRWRAGGVAYELFRLHAEHLGRGGDAAAELSELVLLIESGEGVFAGAAEIGEVFADFGVWLDDGDGAFDPAADAELVTSWQVVGVETRIGLSGFELPATGAATLWLAGITTPSPSLALRLTERGSRRTVRHPGSDPLIRLLEAPAADTTTGWLDDEVDAAGCFGPYELAISGFTVVSGEVVCRAGTDLTARDGGAFGGAGSLVLRAGRSVALGDGFSIADGARLRVEIDPALLPED
ncbi:MAG TPA: VCBS repeat-containing protein, partial [Thermoanaerobaculia bacterium]|nr:VCBS repeat-containing protein [Thermoanaerobaculia bacterium]